MHTILTITGLTLREARSRKILLAALVFGLLFLALFTTGLFFIDRLENTRLPQRRLMVATILMAGLYAVNFLTIMTAVLVPADTLSGEISSGIIQTVVSKPLRRWEVVLGKWIGFWIILLGYLALMAGGVLTGLTVAFIEETFFRGVLFSAVARTSSAAAAVIAAHCARQARSTARGQLWAQAAALDTATLFGGFRIDPVTGAQVKHEAVLVRWSSGGLTLA